MKIGDVFRTSSGGTPLKSNHAYYDGGTVPWLGSGEIAKGYIASAKNKITERALRETSVKMFPKGSVLIAMYGATIGQVGILGINSTTNQAICAIIPNEERAIPEYIYAVLRGARSRFVALGAGGAQPNISQQIIKNFEIPLPPINVQKQIVEEFITEQEISSANQKLVELYEQKIQETLVQIGA